MNKEDDNNKMQLVSRNNEIGEQQQCGINNNVSSEELGNDGACTNSEGSSPKKEFTALCSINTLSSCESIPRKNSLKNDDNEKVYHNFLRVTRGIFSFFIKR